MIIRTDDADPLVRIIELARTLTPGQISLLSDMTSAMTGDIERSRNPRSDLLAHDSFFDYLTNRLRLHHATYEERFGKKPFEYAFAGALRAAGIPATVHTNPTNPGLDVETPETRYSLKTENERDMKQAYIKISKFMEGRWIRECRTGEDFANNAIPRIKTHLAQYDRVFTLRGFSLPGRVVRYDLVKIPHHLLSLVNTLTPADFTPRTEAGSSTASVIAGGSLAFRVVLDGSVEKVQIQRLTTTNCLLHGSWTMPLPSSGGDE